MLDSVQDEISKYARNIVAKGLVVGPGGNISVRSGNLNKYLLRAILH
jgi:ribulose-5-phosphate 4-epimerase/fuculose-1-phosphate aldolase